jgi:hypothetical protein
MLLISPRTAGDRVDRGTRRTDRLPQAGVFDGVDRAAPVAEEPHTDEQRNREECRVLEDGDEQRRIKEAIDEDAGEEADEQEGGGLGGVQGF